MFNYWLFGKEEEEEEEEERERGREQGRGGREEGEKQKQEKRKKGFVAFPHFCGVDNSTMANSKLPVCLP
jgi:hypothetical protein